MNEAISEGILRMPKIKGKVFSCKCGRIHGEEIDFSFSYKNSSNKGRKEIIKSLEKIRNGDYRCSYCKTKVRYRDSEKISTPEISKFSDLNKNPIEIIANNLNLLLEVYTWKMAKYSEIRSGECFVYNGSVYIKIDTSKNSESTSAINIENGERFRSRIEQTHKMFGKKDKITKEIINNLIVLRVEIKRAIEDD